MTAPMLIAIDAESYAAAMAALELCVPIADPDLRPHFEAAMTDLRAARTRWLETDLNTMPSILRRQAD